MKLNKIFKWGMVVLLIISIAILIWGFVSGFQTSVGGGLDVVDILFFWAYFMIGLAAISWVVLGGIVSAKNDPKFLLKTGIVLVGLAAICFVAYLLAPGAPAFGREGLDDAGTLKLTDTILNLTYFAGGCAILAIIVGEIRLAIENKK